MHRNRRSNNQKASLALAAVLRNGGFARLAPSLSAIGGNSADPIRRVAAGEIFGLKHIAAGIGAEVSFVSLDSRVPGLAVERPAALLACQGNCGNPLWMRFAANVLALEPARVVRGWLSDLIKALRVLCAETGLRAEPLALHSAWGNHHHNPATLARFWLAHVFCHGPIVLCNGTTGQVAQQLGRQWIGCELNPDYAPLQNERLAQTSLVLEAA